MGPSSTVTRAISSSVNSSMGSHQGNSAPIMVKAAGCVVPIPMPKGGAVQEHPYRLI